MIASWILRNDFCHLPRWNLERKVGVGHLTKIHNHKTLYSLADLVHGLRELPRLHLERHEEPLVGVLPVEVCRHEGLGLRPELGEALDEVAEDRRHLGQDLTMSKPHTYLTAMKNSFILFLAFLFSILLAPFRKEHIQPKLRWLLLNTSAHLPVVG